MKAALPLASLGCSLAAPFSSGQGAAAGDLGLASFATDCPDGTRREFRAYCQERSAATQR